MRRRLGVYFLTLSFILGGYREGSGGSAGLHND